MAKGTKNVLIFLAGGLIGSLATYIFMKKQFDAECEPIEEAETSEEEKPEEPEPEIKVSEEEKISKIPKEVYKDVLNSYDKTNEFKKCDRDYILEGKEDPELYHHSEPQLISEDEFGEEFEYDAVCVTLYSDGTVADDFGYIYDEPNKTFGTEFLDRLRTEDICWVRNDYYQTDYEIAKDLRTYDKAMQELDNARRTDEE